MKVTCDIVKDILPLYVEGIVSDDTCKLVEEHIISCEDCKSELEKLQTHVNIPIDTNVLPLKKIKLELCKKKLLTIIFSAMLTLVIAIIAFAYLTAPEYIEYSEDVVSITEKSDGTVVLNFKSGVSGFDIEKNSIEDYYSITAWDSIWNRYITKKTSQSIVLNPNGEKVSGIYYYCFNGKDDILIYGANPFSNGGIVTLPRLFLAHYLLLALILIIICVIALIILHKNKVAKTIVTKIMLLPIAFVLALFCIKGFKTISYDGTRDFYAILLLSIPMYSAMLIGIQLFINRKYGRKSI